MSDLKQKSINAIIWSLIEKYGIQLVSLIIGIILARLLTPADYGLMGIITVFFALSMVFVNSGFGAAYIQKKDASETDASTIFYFNVFVSIFFYGVLWIGAPIIAKFYDQSQLVSLIRISAIVLIINSFSMMQVNKLTKDVNFRKKTVISLISTLISGIVGITAALNDYGVWSLVFQQVTRSFTATIGLWFFYNWRPKVVFKLDSLKSMLSFSWWALLSAVVNTFFNNIYILIIGKFFPVSELGFYTKAKGYKALVSEQPTSAIGNVAFPVFSKLQSDKNALKISLKKFLQHTTFFVAPLSAMLIIIANPLILLVLTEKWMPMVPYFKLLLIGAVFYPLLLFNGRFLTAQGKTKLNFNITLIVNLFRIINIVVMYRFGVIYIIYGEILVTLMTIFISTYYTNRLISYGALNQLKDIFVIISISVFMVLLGILILNFISSLYIKIIFGLFFTFFGYLGLSFLFNKRLLLEFAQNFKNFKN